MASQASLTLGFAQTDRSHIPTSLGLPAASYFVHELGILAIGYTSGVIVLFESSEDGRGLRLRAYLTGHHAPIVAFASLAVRSPNGELDFMLLSVSLDGWICKWDVADGRFLQSAYGGLDARPRGLAIVAIQPVNTEGNKSEFNWLTDYHVVLYGCSTSATVLLFTTLSVATLWTGHEDWPILIPVPGADSNQMLSVERKGGLHLWSLSKKPLGRIEFSKVTDKLFPVGDLKFGNVISAYADGPVGDENSRIIVIRANGLAVFKYNPAEETKVSHVKSVDSVSEVKNATVRSKKIYCFLRNGDISIYNYDLEDAGSPMPPKSSEYRIVYYAVTDSKTDIPEITAFIVENDGSNSFMTGFKDSHDAEFQWIQSSLDSTHGLQDSGKLHPSASTASALFEYNFVYAIGNTIAFYTLDQYLLDFSTPSHFITLPNTSDRVSILRTVQLGKTAASDECNYLIVGLVNGSIYVIEPNSFRLSGCLSLHSNPISGAIVLPSDLAPRIRSTLLVYSSNGSASIVDILPAASETSPFKARILLTLPSGMSPKRLELVATQKSKSLLLLVDSDNRKRLWDIDATDRGALVNDTDSPPRSPVATRDGQSLDDMDNSQDPWREHRFQDSKVSSSSTKSIVNDGKAPSAHGYPTATVDIFGIVRYLHKKSLDAEREQILAPDDEVLYPARSLLTVLAEQLGLLGKDGIEIFNLSKETGLELRQMVVQGYKSNIALAQVGCDGSLSLMAVIKSDNQLPAWGSMSPRTKSQLMLSMCSLINAIVHLTTASETVSDSEDLLRRAIKAILSQEIGSNISRLDLALLCEYWVDPNPWIKTACRDLLEVQLSLLDPDEIKTTIEYWQDFLPTQISPELFSLKDVLRSVSVLCVLIIYLDQTTEPSKFKVDRGLRRNVALSIELFLTDNDRVYQDVAIDLVSEGWLSWQSEFDAFEVIHILMRVLATPNLTAERIARINSAFIKIAEKNAPLLASGLANCISHASPEKGIAMTTLTELINLSIAAKKTVVSIVRADPHLFAEPELIKVIMDAIVKILDPQGGQIRERVLQHVSEVVNEVVEAYPTVAFHRPSQKLAVSSSPRAVTIYDLNTAKPVASLEGHAKTAQFLTFSPDGKTVVAADLDESQLLVWKMAVSIFSSFIGAAANIKALGVEGVGVITVKAKHGFRNSKGVGMIRVEFNNDKSINVTAGADVTTLTI